MKRILLRVLAGFGLLLAAVVIGFVIWGSTPQAATDGALQALVSDSAVTVTTDEWITFSPAGQAPRAGLIVYPGGHVDPRAYAPLARQIAAQGYRVVIVPMPLALAVLAPNRALQVMAHDPAIETWAIGGHSLGGAMSARFAYTHPDAVDGLVLWAAYPASTDDLSGYDLVVTSIYGTLDGLATGSRIDASRPLLPPVTRWVAIEGGNHAQFGDYGPQSGDTPAIIPAEEQQALAAGATASLLEDMLQAAR
jgi:pimeloyl-ACP methyl ester carboxylesterase